ncbi:MAG: N-acetylglucosaminyldiphospho-UDP N-acetyl-beta-D-mannosaminyltransferase [Rhodocyclaceae bacterium]|nr:N-acetylglucosaminyldiphospho-UDP N-acetyl-beta-D-mannosaminyltransferase [Rhodocyclaceae bacterium]
MNPSLPWRAGTAPDFGRDVHCLLGLPIDAVDMAQATDALRRAIRLRRACFLSTPNLNFLVASQSDAAFRRSVIDSDLAVADGMPLVWMARLLGIPLAGRVAGSTLLERLRRSAEGDPVKVFFFGGPEGAAEAACRALGREKAGLRGGLRCAGYLSPGFGSVADLSAPALIERINASGADFLVVALGARKGQAWIQRNRARLTVPVVSHLGAAVNFVAGTVSRAPPWMQNAGLEWLWRIKEEPALWRRYGRDGLALARLFLTRVLPHAWFLWRHRPAPRDLAAAAVHIDLGESRCRLALHGAWARENLRLFRDCLSRDYLAGLDLHLDLGAVTYVDSAFVGLLLLLHGYQLRQGRELRIDPVPAAVRRVFHYGCCEFLLCPPTG